LQSSQAAASVLLHRGNTSGTINPGSDAGRRRPALPGVDSARAIPEELVFSHALSSFIISNSLIFSLFLEHIK